MRKWFYIKYYKPTYKLVYGTVDIFYCFRLTKIKSCPDALFVPIRYYRADKHESFRILHSYIREVKFKQVKKSL